MSGRTGPGRAEEMQHVMGLSRRSRTERTAFELYGAAVAAARAPWFFAELGVPDTLDGRFDLVGLHVWLLIRRLGQLPPPGPALAQGVFDAMFSDMDLNLREMGVGDLSVGKKVKAMWEAFHGRAAAYEAATGNADPETLAAALARNVWRGGAAGSGAARLAGVVRRADAALATTGLDELARGQVAFPVPEAQAA